MILKCRVPLKPASSVCKVRMEAVIYVSEEIDENVIIYKQFSMGTILIGTCARRQRFSFPREIMPTEN